MSEIENKIVALWENGSTITEICRTMPCKEGVTKSIIKSLKQTGVLLPRRKKGEVTIEKVLYLHKNKTQNPYEIAEHLGLKASTVKNILVNQKIKRERPKHNYKKKELCERSKTILEMLESGKTPRQVAREMDVSTQWVHILKKRLTKGE